jgi:hypothetical protein
MEVDSSSVSNRAVETVPMRDPRHLYSPTHRHHDGGLTLTTLTTLNLGSTHEAWHTASGHDRSANHSPRDQA